MKRVRPLSNTHSATKIYQALTSEPHFMYCCSVWDGLSQALNEKVQKLQNLAARRIIKSSYDASSGLLLDMLGWDRVSISRAKQKEVVMFKTLNKQIPPTCKICSLFVTFSKISVALRTSCMYPNQELTILSEVLGIQGPSFGMDCHPNYVSR